LIQPAQGRNSSSENSAHVDAITADYTPKDEACNNWQGILYPSTSTPTEHRSQFKFKGLHQAVTWIIRRSDKEINMQHIGGAAVTCKKITSYHEYRVGQFYAQEEVYSSPLSQMQQCIAIL
jgi:hypothetical protein